MATSTVPALALGLAAALSAAPAIAEGPPFGAEPPLVAAALAEHCGRFTAPTTVDGDAASLSATVTDSSTYFAAGADVVATNAIDGGAFADAAGVITVIQNAGNNVVIQTGVAVTIEMVR